VSARARRPPTQPPDRPSADDLPTTIYDSGELPARKRSAPVTAKGQPTLHDKPKPQAVQAVSKQEQSAPIQAISMKTPADAVRAAQPENPPTPILPRPKLRAALEVTPLRAPPAQNLGNLAQPYDPKEAKARAVREYVIWGCIAVILASAIALAVWFLAR